MPYVKRDWKMWATKKICPECKYYGECIIDLDCKALQIVVKIYEDLDSSDPDQ